MLWLACVLVLLATVTSHEGDEADLPNGFHIPDPCRHGQNWLASGHINPYGGALNQFGQDYKAEGYTWTVALCQMDSDNDGHTNGFELGDPSCSWKRGHPEDQHAKSHPGINEKVYNCSSF